MCALFMAAHMLIGTWADLFEQSPPPNIGVNASSPPSPLGQASEMEISRLDQMPDLVSPLSSPISTAPHSFPDRNALYAGNGVQVRRDFGEYEQDCCLSLLNRFDTEWGEAWWADEWDHGTAFEHVSLEGGGPGPSNPIRFSDSEPPASLRTTKSTSLWDPKLVYPSGIKETADPYNLRAALQYDCPCHRSCLSRYLPEHIHEHRLLLKQEALNTKRGKLASCMYELSRHYSGASGCITNSFKVGAYTDNCPPAWAVAGGYSDITFARARAEVNRTRGNGTTVITPKDWCGSQEHVRRHLQAYVRQMKSRSEGSKSMQAPRTTFSKRSQKQRFEDYVRHQESISQPVLGSPYLLNLVIKQDTEIHQRKAKEQDICDDCHEFDLTDEKLKGLTTADAQKKRAENLEARRVHEKFKNDEIAYGEDWWATAQASPRKVTAIRVDAPTQSRFNMPQVNRTETNESKSLSGTAKHKWKSKVTGAWDARLGMRLYLVRSALGVCLLLNHCMPFVYAP